MFFRRSELHPIGGSARVRRPCANCGNEVDLELHFVKAGPGLGIPVLMWFSDAFVVTTHKKYYLVCPVCTCALEVNKDLAKGLMR